MYIAGAGQGSFSFAAYLQLNYRMDSGIVSVRFAKSMLNIMSSVSAPLVVGQRVANRSSSVAAIATIKTVAPKIAADIHHAGTFIFQITRLPAVNIGWLIPCQTYSLRPLPTPSRIKKNKGSCTKKTKWLVGLPLNLIMLETGWQGSVFLTGFENYATLVLPTTDGV